MNPTTEDRLDNHYPCQLDLEFGKYQLHLDVPEGVWNPTPHGIHLGRMLIEMCFEGEHVLELGTGCGIHAILLANRGADRLTLTEMAREQLQNGLHNCRENGVTIPIEGLIADWTRIDGQFDVLVTNPPFAKSGKLFRRYFIETLILDAHKLVRPGGRLIFVQSSMADIPRSMRLMQENGMSARIVGETSGPFRDYYYQDQAFMREIAAIPGAYCLIEGRHFERLIVFEARIP